MAHHPLSTAGDFGLNPRPRQIVIAAGSAGLSQVKMKGRTKGKTSGAENGRKIVAVNKKARFDFFVEDIHEAGLALEGWEVKSLRAGKAQITESYVLLKEGEAWLFGAHITPLSSASTHVQADPTRTRKLLLHRREIDALIGAVERRGYTLVPLKLYFKNGRAKLEIGLGRGKKKHDKRAAEKDRDWKRQRERLLKH
jgi:SsrA-binding protein